MRGKKCIWLRIIKFKFDKQYCKISLIKKKCTNESLHATRLSIAFTATRYFLPRVQFAKHAVAYKKKFDTARTSGIRLRMPLISKSWEFHVDDVNAPADFRFLC